MCAVSAMAMAHLAKVAMVWQTADSKTMRAEYATVTAAVAKGVTVFQTATWCVMYVANVVAMGRLVLTAMGYQTEVPFTTNAVCAMAMVLMQVRA